MGRSASLRPLRIADDLRYSCHRCAACCRSFAIDLDPGEAHRISRRAWHREDARFADGFFREALGADGVSRDTLLQRPDGACIFLDTDDLCLIQKRLGPGAKPRVCRHFPFVFVAGPDAVRVTASVECVSRHRSVTDGPLLTERRAELRDLLRRCKPLPIRWRVRLCEGGPLLSLGAYAGLERRLFGEIAQKRPLAETLSALAGVVEARVRRSGAAPSAAEPGIADVLGALLPIAATIARERGDDRTARRTATFGAAPERWRTALEQATARPDAAAFFRVVLRTWLEEAFPGRAPTAEDGIGRMLLGAILVATSALADAIEPDAVEASAGTAPAPDAATVNRAAARVSFLFRFDEQSRPPRLAGRSAALARALARL